MHHHDLAKTFVLTSSLLGGCLVQLPGNLDAGSSGNSDDGTDDGTDDGDPGDGDGDPGDGDGDGDPEPGPIDGDGCQAALDVLLIIDNSGSMGEEQALLASALIQPLLAPLDLSGVDWRFAITTTDNGNDWCAGTTPEAGAFQLKACNDHPEDFLFNNGQVNVQDVACNSICQYAPGKLHTLPTTTAEDPEPKARPWMESIGGVTNLPEDIDPALAALCFVPQGINGCGFEQPLESMALALLREDDPAEQEFGFLRDNASLLVILVTDEEDCSYDKEHASIFAQDGNKAFWADQTASFPTSAVCWNAGTSCSGDPADYDDCVSANYDEDGDPTAPDQAVLHPISRYIDILTDIEQQKRAVDPGADVSVLVIGGLGTDGQLHYAEVGDTDPDFQNSFGIGPGCEAPPPMGSTETVHAVPPVRLREVGEALSSEPLASICAPSFEDSLSGAYQRLFGSCE